MYYIHPYEIELLRKGEISKNDIIKPERKIITSYTGEDLIKEIGNTLDEKDTIRLINYISHNAKFTYKHYIYELINKFLTENILNRRENGK